MDHLFGSDSDDDDDFQPKVWEHGGAKSQPLLAPACSLHAASCRAVIQLVHAICQSLEHTTPATRRHSPLEEQQRATRTVQGQRTRPWRTMMAQRRCSRQSSTRATATGTRSPSGQWGPPCPWTPPSCAHWVRPLARHACLVPMLLMPANLAPAWFSTLSALLTSLSGRLFALSTCTAMLRRVDKRS